MKKLNLVLSLTVMLFLVACKSKNSVETIALNYFSSNSELIGFGKISFGQIIDQSKVIENVPIAAALIKDELGSVKACIDIDQYIYFGVDGKDAKTIGATAFATVKNVDSLNNYLKERGYSVEKKNNLNIAEEDELIFVFDKDLLAVRAGKNQERDDFVKTFQSLKDGKGKTDENIVKSLSKDAPILVTLFPDKAYNLNSDEELKKHVSGDLYNGVLQCVDVQFLKGKIEITNEFLGDKDKLAKLNFLKDAKASQAFKISKNAIFDLALNIDLGRIEKENSKLFDYLFAQFLDDDDTEPNPNDFKGLIRMFSTKEHPLTSVFSGLFFVTADRGDNEQPTLKYYIGSTNTEFKNYLKDFQEKREKNSEVKITPNAIEGTLFKSSKAIDYTQNSGAADNVFKLYLDMDFVTEYSLAKGYKEATYTKPLKSVDMYSKENITKLTITTKEPNKNALEYLVKTYTTY
ncbi:MAG TPA: hypothetical protein PLP27_03420 [Crocinitomicaceae bacterium]|nr:hypothetical protein [Crocinitomicaceae bacterium]